MEENKEEKQGVSQAMEESQLSMPEMAKHQMDNYIYLKEKEQKEKDLKHKEALKDINYRRWYYQHEIQKHMDMIPREYYYQAEYEEMQVLCEKYIKKMDSLENIEDFEALLKEFRKKTGKKLDANKVVLIVMIGFIVLFAGFMAFMILRN